MTPTSIEMLQTADTRLTRSFICCVATVLASMGWALFVSPPVPGQPSPALAIIGLLQIASYIWFAISAGGAARVLGATAWHYVTWILVAPILALVPIPIVSSIIGISPLSIKFLLGGQLQTALREETAAVLRPTS